MKKTEDEKVYVVKTLKLISPEEAVEIWEKQNKIRKTRAEKRKIHKESKKSK